MKVLITGAGGQIGTDLIPLLGERGYKVYATDITVQPPGVDVEGWHHLDVTDRSAVLGLFRMIQPDIVYHLAAILSARGEEVPQTTYNVNQRGTFHVLEACRETAVRQMIFTSSIAVYGPGLADPTPDTSPLLPTTMYGVTKAAGELLGAYYHSRYDFDFRGVRFPGLISASLPGGGTSDYALFMYVDGVRIGRYEAFCRPDSRIPLMYMPDALRALVELSEAPAESLTRRVYNIAAFSPTAEEIAASVKRLVPDVKITFRPDTMRQAILDSWPRSLDDSHARADWAWKHAFNLEQMTDDLVPKIKALLGQE